MYYFEKDYIMRLIHGISRALARIFLNREVEEGGRFVTRMDKAARQAEIEVKYAGYIAKEKREAEHLKKLERMKLPEDMDYSKVEQLSLEARQKLNEVRPLSIAQASRISGVSPADLQVLSMVCKAKRNSSKE